MNDYLGLLYGPHLRPHWINGRILVLLILIISFFVLLATGQGPTVAVAGVLAAGMAAADVARRLLGPAPRDGYV